MALLAALQASDLPAAVAKLLNSLAPSTASAVAIQNIIAQAEGLKAIGDLMAKSPLAAALDGIKTSSQSASSAVEAAGKVLLTLAGNYDKTAASSQTLTTATTAYYNAVVATIAQTELIKTSISNMFASTIQAMKLSTLDTAGKYAFYQSDEATAAAAMAASSDPATIQALSTRINNDFNAAFGLLTPQQQKDQLNTFTDNISKLNTATTAQLATIQKNTSDAATAILTTIQTAFADASVKQGQAADGQVAAAQIQLAAAQTPVTVFIQGAPAVNG